jgi:hypothetical protein
MWSISRAFSVIAACGTGRSPIRGAGTTSWRSVETITARSMTFRNSRTLPGHG